MRPQPVEQRRGLVFPRLHLQRRQRFPQGREDQGQQIGRERRDDAEPEAPGQRVAQVAGDREDRIRLRHRGPDMADQPGAGGGGRHAFAGALEQRHAKQFFELAELHRERRLADAAGLRGAAEMPLLGHGEQIAEVTKVHRVRWAAIIVPIYHTGWRLGLPFIVGMQQAVPGPDDLRGGRWHPPIRPAPPVTACDRRRPGSGWLSGIVTASRFATPGHRLRPGRSRNQD